MEIHLGSDVITEKNIMVPMCDGMQAGHCIRLDVSSSNFPRFDLNTNTGGQIFTESPADVKTAKNMVYHDQKYPSRLILPVIERD